MAIYIAGVTLYRFGLEVFNGSIITLALDRFAPDHTFEKVGALTGINQAMQCVGAVLIVQLSKSEVTVGTTGKNRVNKNDAFFDCCNFWTFCGYSNHY